MTFHTRSHTIVRYLASLILVFLVSGCIFNPAPTPTPQASIVSTPDGPISSEKPVQVLVWDDEGQVPLTRANVSLTIPNQIFPVKLTDNTGKAVFDVREELLTQTATFIIQKEGYQPQTHIVTLANAPVLTVYLVPVGATAVPREVTNTPVPPTPEPSSTVTPTPTATFTPTNTPTPTLTPTLAPTNTPQPQPAVITSEITLTRKEDVETVFVLAGPDVSNVPLGTLAVDEIAILIGRTQQNEWLQIKTERDVEGWVANCEVVLSSSDLDDVPIAWNGAVTAKTCATGNSGTTVVPAGPCVNVTLSRTDWPSKEFDDVLMTWSNVPANATQLWLWVEGPTNDGVIAYVIHPTASDIQTPYKVELFKFEDGDFKPGVPYTYVVQPLNAAGSIICTTQGTFVP